MESNIKSFNELASWIGKEKRKKYTRAVSNVYYGKTYGVPITRVKEKYIEQNGGCAICRTKFESKFDFNVDHDHLSGKVRGLLCRRCNTELGWIEYRFNKNPDYIMKSVAYLAKWKPCN